MCVTLWEVVGYNTIEGEPQSSKSIKLASKKIPKTFVLLTWTIWTGIYFLIKKKLDAYDTACSYLLIPNFFLINTALILVLCKN
jgi:hypothetical protein